MKFITFLIGFIFLISCNTNQPQNSDTYHDSVRLDTISNYQPIKKPNKQRWDTLYVSMNNDALVFGDSTNKEISYVAIKYEPHINFLDFKVDSVFKGQRHSLDFSSNPPSKMFITRIREAYKSGNANFAGHYYLTDWGCGSPCQMCVIVDLVSGRIYDGPGAALGYEFQKG